MFVHQLRNLLGQKIYQFSNSRHSNKHKQNGRFIGTLFNTGEQLPFLCRKASTSGVTLEDSPLLSFVIPTIDTFNLLQQMAHGPSAVLPIGVVGPVTTRMIRAYEEIPAALLSREALTKTQQLLKNLYPTVTTLKANARPLELTHPDTIKTTSPHGANCSDFLLSWHDLLHAWRSGANFKPIFHRLRQLHDGTAGLDNNKRGMSRALWALSDLDCSLGAAFLRAQNAKTAMQCYRALTLIIGTFDKAGFKYHTDHDDNYLMSYSVCRDDWQPLFFHQSLTSLYEAMILDSYVTQRFNDSAYAIPYRELMGHFAKVNEHLLQDPQASVIDVILSQRLKPLQSEDRALLVYLKKYYNTLFFWSKNDGLYFKKTFTFPKINRCVALNNSDAIRAALYESIGLLHKNQQDALIDLIQTAEPLLLYKVLPRYPEAYIEVKSILKTKAPFLLRRLLVDFHQLSHDEKSQILLLLMLTFKNADSSYEQNDLIQLFLDTIRQQLTCWPASNLLSDQKSDCIEVLRMMNCTGFIETYDYYRIVLNTVWFSWFTNLVLVLMLFMDDGVSELETDFGLCFKVFALLHICESLIKASDEVLRRLNCKSTVYFQQPTNSNAFNNIYKKSSIPSKLVKFSLFVTPPANLHDEEVSSSQARGGRMDC